LGFLSSEGVSEGVLVERRCEREQMAATSPTTMKRGPRIAATLGVSLATWASVYAFAPLSPAMEQVVALVRAKAARLTRPCAHALLVSARCSCARGSCVRSQLPYTALIWFGCYSLATISYNMLTFRECPEAAASLLEEIREARQALSKKGINVD